jgi:lysophospholipase L1-like esterase
MARLPVPGSDSNTWGNILNDFLGVEHNTDGTLKASGSLSDKVSTTDPRLSDTRTPTDNSVTTDKLQDNAVTGAKIATNTVPVSKLLLTGTADGTKFIRDDGTLQSISNGVTTRRVTVPIASDGQNSSVNTFTEFLWRTLVQLPATTTRWRLRIRNSRCGISGAAEDHQTGAITFPNGLYIGDPAYPSADGSWVGAMTGSPVQALSAFATPADGSDFTTDWVTDPTKQFSAGRTVCLSMGGTCASGQVIYREAVGGVVFAAAGTGQLAAQLAAPLGVKSAGALWLDARLEYEFQTPASQPMKVGLFIGDSVTLGVMSPLEGFGIFTHESWPGGAGLRNPFVAINAGVRGSTSADWTTNTDWKWTRLDLATSLPDFAVITLGHNELASTTATVKANLVTIAANIRARGIQRIYWGTVIPFGQTNTNETNRVALNAWLRSMPCGAAGVFDFDKALALQATPATADPDLATTVHPLHAGYQAMADLVRIG